MRLPDYWRPAGLQEPLIGSYLRSADKTLLLLLYMGTYRIIIVLRLLMEDLCFSCKDEVWIKIKCTLVLGMMHKET